MATEKALSIALGEQLSRDISKAVCEAFDKTFSITVKPGRYVVGKGSVELNGDVSGIVGLMQDKLEGTMTISFSIESIRKIVPRLLGPEIDVTREVAMDAVGELTNMIFGQMKTELNQRGHHVRFGMPSVVNGPGHFISHLHEGEYLIMSFEMENSLFQVHIAIHNND